MHLIQAEKQHVSLVSRLFDQYRQFYGQPADLPGAMRFIQTRIARKESVIYLATPESEGEVAAGFVQLYPSFSSVSMRRLWVLNDLFVHPEFRNRGVATQLLHHARKLAQETDAASLMLETAVSNVQAQALYEKLGWVRSDDYYVYYQRAH
jgi:ribosomal protein S18 acetylase RimI-like enzyme